MTAEDDLSALKAAEDAVLELLDRLVFEDLLLEPGAEFSTQDLVEAWRRADSVSWFGKRWARQFANRWLRAAEERGEIVGRLESTPRHNFARKVYRLAG